MRHAKKGIWWGLLAITACAAFALGGTNEDAASDKARQVVDAAIEAMGGERYLQVRTVASTGRYFGFRNNRKSFTRFQDWSQYEPPVKSRFELGKGKRTVVWVYNLDLDKGWKREGPFDRTDLNEEEMKDFRRRVKRDPDYLLRHRLDEEGLKMFYYGPDEIAGSGTLEAVEFVDTSNDSVVIYFKRDTHLPYKTESYFVDKLGIRRKSEFELENWHETDGVLIPHNYYGYVDGEKVQERFLETVEVNPSIPRELFLEPEVKERKKKKK